MSAPPLNLLIKIADFLDLKAAARKLNQTTRLVATPSGGRSGFLGGGMLDVTQTQDHVTAFVKDGNWRRVCMIFREVLPRAWWIE